jgi:hypothetical protein
VHSAARVITSRLEAGSFTGGPLVEAMFLARHRDDVHGEGAATVDFTVTARR